MWGGCCRGEVEEGIGEMVELGERIFGEMGGYGLKGFRGVLS